MFFKKKETIKDKFDKLIRELHTKERQWRDRYGIESYGGTPYSCTHISSDSVTEDGKIWLNGNEEYLVDCNWISLKDLEDWVNDRFNTLIFRSEEHMAELYFLCTIPDWIWLKDAHEKQLGICPKSFKTKNLYFFGEDKGKFIDITKSEEEVVSDILSVMKMNCKHSFPYVHKIRKTDKNTGYTWYKIEGAPDWNNKQVIDKENWGMSIIARMIGFGVSGASNTPEIKENFNWSKDIVYYEALLEHYLGSGVISKEDFDKYFVNSVTNRG